MNSLNVAAHNALISAVTMYAQIIDDQRKEHEKEIALLHMKLAELDSENKALKAKNTKHPLDI